MFDRREAEGTKRRHQVDTVVEGMYVCVIGIRKYLRSDCDYRGINRLTHNFELGLSIIGDAFRYNLHDSSHER